MFGEFILLLALPCAVSHLLPASSVVVPTEDGPSLFLMALRDLKAVNRSLSLKGTIMGLAGGK